VSFVILRHAKIKSSARGAVISHNHRLSDEIEKINIDPKNNHLNHSLMGQGAMQRLNAKLPAKMRKDAVIAIETLITASPEFFDAIEKDRAKLSQNPKFKKWVLDSQIWMKKEWGDNVVDAVLHMDESSPHIHFLTVPLMKDGRLCAKDFLALGVMQRHQSEYAEAMASHGLQRGLPVKETKRRHIGLKESPAGSGGQASQLAAQLAATQVALNNSINQITYLKTRNEVIRTALVKLEEKEKEMDEYSRNLKTDLAEKDRKIAMELIAKAKVIEDLVQAGVKSDALLVTAEGHRAAAAKLTAELAVSEAKVVVLTAENVKLVTDAAQFPEVDKEPVKTLRDAFLGAHEGLPVVRDVEVDGMRLDAFEGRLGLFSRHDRSQPNRVSVLCELPLGKVMPGIGKCFDSRALSVHEQQKGGLGG